MGTEALPFRDVLVARAIRAIEANGPLEDAAALRRASRVPTRERQVVERALALGERIGLVADLQRLAALVPLALLGCALLVAALTGVLVGAVLGEGRRINVVLAWFGTLGPHALGMLLWALAALAPASAALAPFAKGWAGLATWLASRPRWAGSHAPALVHEAGAMLREARQLPWAFGLLNHTIWAASFALLLAVLAGSFAFRAYQLSWESTILPPAFFVEFVARTGAPLAALGLPGGGVHGLAPGDAGFNRALAVWLMGCVMLYGLVPRLLLALWCWRRWARARVALHVDLDDPYWRRVADRIERLREPLVVDAEGPRLGADGAEAPAGRAPDGGRPVWIAFELPPDAGWHAIDATSLETVAGDSASRRRLLAQLSASPAPKAIVVCNGTSSPDRGTERFLHDVSAHVARLGLLLVGPAGDTRFDPTRWTRWLRERGLGHLPVFTSVDAARSWSAEAAA